MEAGSVAIVGAGVAGLQALRALQQLPLEKIVLFEKSLEVGGVWRENYHGYGAQVKREQYSFVELGTEGLDLYPTGRQLKGHCQAYAETFSLSPALRLGCPVQKLLPLARGWRVVYDERGTCHEEDFDFVVLAVGNFSKKFVPSIKGREDFLGTVLHSSELVDATLLSGHVLVVGYGKSALDCFALATRSRSTTLVARSPAWVLPRRFLGIPLDYLASTRWFADLVFPPYYDASLWRQLLGMLLLPLQTLLWCILAPIVWLHFRLPWAMRPVYSLRWQLWHGHSVSICDAPELRKAFNRPRAHCLRGEIVRFLDTGVVVRDQHGERALPADVVIFATGYQEAWSKLFDEETGKALGQEPELYKLILPAVPRLAFLGRVLSTCDIVTSYVQAQWLAAYLAGHIALRAPKAMALRYRRWRELFGPRCSTTALAVPRLFSYLDELLQDMGYRPKGGCAPLRAAQFSTLSAAKVVALKEQV